MLTLEAMKGGSEGSYYLNTIDPSKPAILPVEKYLPSQYRDRGVPPLAYPSDQLSDAQRLLEIAFCKLDRLVSEDDQLILSFVGALKEQARVPEEVVFTIGMLIYLGESDSGKLAALIDVNDVKNSLAKVKAAFLEAVERQSSKIQESVNHEYYAGIFDYELSERQKKTLLIANLLVTESGWVNSPLIPVIIEHILSDQDPHQKEVIAILNALHYASTKESNIPFTEHFFDVRAPDDQLSIMSDVIRATLQVVLDDNVTDRHCRVAILTAVLTHDNRIIPPSLFSREVLAERMDEFVLQLSHCIRNEKVNISDEEIKVSLKLKQSTFDKKIKLRRTGTVSKVQEEYWGQSLVKWWYPPYKLGDVPSISRAFEMMGLSGSAVDDLDIISGLFKNTTASSKVIEVSKVLWEAAAYSTRPETSREAILSRYERGVLGLLSETGCPLLHVWRKFINKVEKVDPLKSRSKRIQRCVISVFSHVIEDKMEHHRMKQIYRLFFSTFYEQIKIYEGYNTLYDVNGDPIHSAKSFKGIIKHSLNTAKESLLTTLQSDSEKEGYGQLFEKLQMKVIDSHNFSYQFAVAYDPRNKETMGSDEYPHNTPWNEFKPFELPTFFTAIHDPVSFKDETLSRPKNVGRFVEQWINRLRSNREGCDYVLPMHSTMEAMMDDSKSTIDLLSDYLIQPGLEISTEEIDLERQVQFIKVVKKKFVPLTQERYFDEKVSPCIKDLNILSMFCSNILKLVLDSVELDDGDREKTSLSFTNLVIQHLLLPEQRQSITEQALHIFPTNWSDEEKTNFHFVAFFNPVTSNLSLGMSDGAQIQELDQYDYIESGHLNSLLGELLN